MVAAELEQVVREVVQSAPAEVMAIYLYGSRARGEPKATSDVDLGVLLREAPTPRLGGVAPDLESAVEKSVHFAVDAVVMNTAPADLVHRILRDGILLLDRDPAARIRFEVQARNEYFDLEPIRRLYRRLPR